MELIQSVILMALLTFLSNACMGDDVACLQAFKASVKDVNGYLVNWDFRNISRGRVCTFKGVQCWTDQENRVLTLKVSEAGLSGPFPSGLSNCISLTGLDLSNNGFYGPIPNNICQQMAFLTTLDLSQNKFSGDIPDNLGNCKYLHELHLQQNQLKGPIPWGIGVLNRLTDLDMSSNSLTGQIPSSFTNRTAIGQPGFGAATFADNPGLCGPPLKSSCGKASSKSKLPVIVGGVIAVTLVFVLIGAAVMWRLRLRPQKKCSVCMREFAAWTGEGTRTAACCVPKGTEQQQQLVVCASSGAAKVVKQQSYETAAGHNPSHDSKIFPEL